MKLCHSDIRSMCAYGGWTYEIRKYMNGLSLPRKRITLYQISWILVQWFGSLGGGHIGTHTHTHTHTDNMAGKCQNNSYWETTSKFISCKETIKYVLCLWNPPHNWIWMQYNSRLFVVHKSAFIFWRLSVCPKCIDRHSQYLSLNHLLESVF